MLVNREKLATAVETIIRSPKATHGPAVVALAFDREQKTLQVGGDNIDATVYASIEVEPGNESANSHAGAVEAEILSKLLKLSSVENVELKFNEKSVTIDAGSNRSRLHLIQDQNYASMAVRESRRRIEQNADGQVEFSAPSGFELAKAIKKSISLLNSATAKPEELGGLYALFCSVKNSKLQIMTTDRYRLLLVEQDLGGASGDIEFVLNPDYADAMIHLLTGAAQYIAPTIVATKSYTKIVTPRISVQCPNSVFHKPELGIDAIIASSTHSVSVPAKALSNAIQRVSLLAEAASIEKIKQIAVSIKNNAMILESKSSYLGDSTEHLDVSVNSDNSADVRFLINAVYFAWAASSAVENCQICFNPEKIGSVPIVFKLSPNETCLIMPMVNLP